MCVAYSPSHPIPPAITPPQTKQACKAQKTSVTGALVAATCQAMQGFIADDGSYKLKVQRERWIDRYIYM